MQCPLREIKQIQSSLECLILKRPVMHSFLKKIRYNEHFFCDSARTQTLCFKIKPSPSPSTESRQQKWAESEPESLADPWRTWTYMLVPVCPPYVLCTSLYIPVRPCTSLVLPLYVPVRPLYVPCTYHVRPCTSHVCPCTHQHDYVMGWSGL